MTMIEQDVSGADTSEEFHQLASEGVLIGVICQCTVCGVCSARSRGWCAICPVCGEGVPPPEVVQHGPEPVVVESPPPPNLTFGYLVQPGSDTEHPEAEFMNCGRVASANEVGRRVVNLATFEDVPLHDEKVHGLRVA